MVTKIICHLVCADKQQALNYIIPPAQTIYTTKKIIFIYKLNIAAIRITFYSSNKQCMDLPVPKACPVFVQSEKGSDALFVAFELRNV